MAFKQESLYQQIQSLKNIPNPRQNGFKGRTDSVRDGAAKYKQLSDELRSLLIEVVHLQLTSGSEERIAFLESEIAVVEADRNKLKAEYWKSSPGGKETV